VAAERSWATRPPEAPATAGLLVWHLQFLTAAGDATVAVSLAGTLFFTVPTQQARPEVAQFLLLTMAPFAIVAPFIGPFLDRFRRGRRWALGITLALRGFLCWVLAGTPSGSAWLFGCALLFLVASKAFTITRAAAVPRLLPEGFTLVNANSRISMGAVLGISLPLIPQLGFAIVAALLIGLLIWTVVAWRLRLARTVPADTAAGASTATEQSR
jgi:MFS family permease